MRGPEKRLLLGGDDAPSGAASLAAGSADHEGAVRGLSPEVPEPREKGPHEGLGEDEAEEQAEGRVAFEQVGDVVVTDAEAAREEEASDADGDGAECGPPHPVDGEMAEEALRSRA